MKIFFRLLSIALFAAALPLSANANILRFEATLSAANEPSLIAPSIGQGIADVVLDDVTNMLTVSLTWVNLTGAALAGHIHCCAPLGSSGAVRVPFTGLPASASGSFTGTFALPGTLPGMPPLSLADFITGLKTGQAYVNLHTLANTG